VLGVMLAHPGDILDLPGVFFGLFWDPSGPSLCHIQSSWGHLDYLGTLMGHLGPSQSLFWAVLRCLGTLAVLGFTWGLGLSGACFRNVFGLAWGRF